jgi:predicted TIM-barrel fold metal-dependent hydrolase
MARIDAHLHIFAPYSAQFPREVDETLHAARSESAEKLLALMAEHAIDQAMVVQIGGASIEQHAYLLDCLRRYPSRFQGIGLIPTEILTGLADPAEHMATLAAGGIVGFRLLDLGGPGAEGAPLCDHPIYPIWAYATAHDQLIWLYPRLADLPLVPRLLAEFPSSRVVLNHLGVTRDPGKFFYDETGRPRIDVAFPPPIYPLLAEIASHEHVVVKLSGQYAFSHQPYPYRDLAEWHQTLYHHFGADRLMWASDFPWIVELPSYGAVLKVVDELLPGLNGRERDAILGETAHRFLRFPKIE